MTEPQPPDEQTMLRRMVGSPPVWLAALWLLFGCGWPLEGIADPSAFRFFIAGAGLLIAVPQLIVAVRDRKNHTGRYRRAEPVTPDRVHATQRQEQP